MNIIRDIQIVAMAHASVSFGVSGWTTLSIKKIEKKITYKQPGEDIGSILIENKSTSASSVHFVFKNDPGVDVSYSHGFEIGAGGVLQEGTVKNLRYVSFRGATGSGTVKVILRSYRTADQAPWDN